MSKDYINIASELYSTPLMLDINKAEQLSRVFQAKINGEVVEETQMISSEAGSVSPSSDAISVIPVHGTLVRRGSSMKAISGLQSYTGLRNQLEAAFNSNSNAILLDIDSYGGAATGNQELVNYIIDMKAKTNKPVWAIANHFAMSAAYAIAVAADKIFVTPTAGVGSVGVIALHTDQSERNKKEGLKYTAIYAGKYKYDGNPNEPLSASAKKDIQENVDALYDNFVSLVSENRPMSENDVRATEAGVFAGQDAVDAGLADGVVRDIEEAMTRLTAISGGSINGAQAQSFTPNEETSMSNKTEVAAAESTTDTVVAEAVAQERDRVVAILNHPEAKGREAMAMKLVETGASVESAAELLAVAPVVEEKATENGLFDRLMESEADEDIGASDGESETDFDASWDAVIEKQFN